jgi:acetyl esterase
VALSRLRARAGGLAITRSLAGTAALAKRVPLADPARHGVVVTRDVPYLRTGLVEHTLDIWRPASSDRPLPLLLYVHGGAFRSLSKDTHWIMGLTMARRGFVVVVPNYRLAPKHRFPAGSADVAHALSWAIAHGERFGADTRTVVLAGESAGANITLGLVTGLHWDVAAPHLDVIRDVEIAAAMPACGVFQVGDPGRFRRIDPAFNWFFNDRVHELTDWLPRRGGDVVEDPVASPLPFLETAPTPTRPVPPLFLPVGGGDFLVDDHIRLARAMAAMGLRAELEVYGREPHAFQAFIWRREARRFWRETADFLRRHGVPVREPPPVT